MPVYYFSIAKQHCKKKAYFETHTNKPVKTQINNRSVSVLSYAFPEIIYVVLRRSISRQ